MLTFSLIACSAKPDKRDLIAATIFAESEHTRSSELDVASAIFNRAQRSGNLATVCAKPRQFSCWNDGEVKVRYDKASMEAWCRCHVLAHNMLASKFIPTHDGTFFHDDRRSKPPKAWGKVKLVKVNGRLKFYRKETK